ncbi:MAG TPA: periplasmic heavy metal sensor [Reyranella sp.]|nr:periplasmic heavy metal sensor [Reyranella sp.]
MSARLTQLLLGLSLLLNCFVLAGFVYRSWIAPPHWERPMMPPPGPGRGPMELLSDDLKLNDSQRKALHGLFEQYGTERRDRFREIQKVRESMIEQLKKPDFDMTQISSLVDQMSKLRAEQQKENLSAIAQLSPQLTPEQREHLHQILVDRYGGGRPPGERRMPRGQGQERPPR